MTDSQTPMLWPFQKDLCQLKQVSISHDEEIVKVNELLSDGWRLLSVGFQPGTTVYVLGRVEDHPRQRAGFLGG